MDDDLDLGDDPAECPTTKSNGWPPSTPSHLEETVGGFIIPNRYAIHDALLRSGAPQKCVGCLLRDFGVRHADANDGWRAHGGFLIPGSKNGMGKTSLAASLAAHRIRDRYLVRDPSERHENRWVIPEKPLVWKSSVKLLLEIQSTYDNRAKGSTEELVREYASCRLMVIDDFGAEKDSEWSWKILASVLDERINNHRDTIITTNDMPEQMADKEIAATTKARISSRLKDLRIIMLKEIDWRVVNGRQTPIQAGIVAARGGNRP